MKQRHADDFAWYEEFKGVRERWTSAGDDYIGDTPFKQFVYAQEAETWEDFVSWCKALHGGWGFRGQSAAEWALNPSLDRALMVSGEGPGFSFGHREEFKVFEDRLLFRFRRAAHHYSSHVPESSDLTSWLAMMQHHGVPTRLLDWSLSPYVAAYFAMEEKTDRCAIWAINLDWLEARGNSILASLKREVIPSEPFQRAAYINKLIADAADIDGQLAPRMVVKVEPLTIDRWMAGQRGFFICKCWNYPSFSQLIMRMMIHPELVTSPIIRKLEISGDLRFTFLERLAEANIDRASLFPDLDGFSRSLRLDLVMQIDSLRRGYEEQTQIEQYFRRVREGTLDDGSGDADSKPKN